MTAIDATACIARELGRHRDAKVIPADGGSDIDVAPRGLWGPKSEPWQTYTVRSASGVTTLRALYRHPVRQGAVDKEVAKLREHCLRVKSIDPA